MCACTHVRVRVCVCTYVRTCACVHACVHCKQFLYSFTTDFLLFDARLIQHTSPGLIKKINSGKTPFAHRVRENACVCAQACLCVCMCEHVNLTTASHLSSEPDHPLLQPSNQPKKPLTHKQHPATHKCVRKSFYSRAIHLERNY